MIIVSGANGTLGRGVVEHLMSRLGPEGIGVSVREPDKAAALAARGVRVRRGDFTDPDSLRDAFEGGRQVLIISSNTRAGDTLEQHRVAIDAAVAAGAERIVYTSHAGARPDSHFPPARDHFATEQMLEDSGIPFTSLRNGFYAVTPSYYLGSMPDTAAIAVPRDGPVAWTTQADLAEAAALILAEEGRFDGPSPALTAGEALTFDDVAAILADLTGREVKCQTIQDEDFVSAQVSEGMPEPAARFMLGMFLAARSGDFATVNPTLEHLLGRPPTTLKEVLAKTVRHGSAGTR
ncbi:MAG: NAD(P)H-binding protein [Actinomycetota bacterium]|nr:NAD(P)H-binding protein [Actinomycetota bacterium]